MKIQIASMTFAALLPVIVPGLFSAQAGEFKSATITETINEVFVIKDQKPSPAKINERVSAAETLKTGKKSRASLEFADKTIARVGANSVFSFKGDTREINLQTGSILFNSPSGKGGGQIRTAAATAAVTGTTIIVVATANGGFKMLVLEGSGKVTMPNGYSTDLKAGQLSFILPGMTEPPRVIEFNLGDLIKGSTLVNGFDENLSSTQKIETEVKAQDQKIAKGEVRDTGTLIGEVDKKGNVKVLDLNTLQAVVADTERLAFIQGLFNDQFLVSPTLDRNNVFLNPFLEAQNIFGAKNLPTKFYAFPARNMYFVSPHVDLSGYQADTFAFAALNDIEVFNQLIIQGFNGKVVLAANGKIITSPGGHIENLNGDLSLSVKQAFTVNQLVLKAVGHKLNVETEGSLVMNVGSFDAFSVDLQANNLLSLSFVNFINTSTINMQAQTIFLQGIQFPAGSQVFLNSGSPNFGYPQFGNTPVPGKVTFGLTSPVRYNGNPMYNNGDFNTFGANIHLN
ncbi:MAG: FecR domain-containing protein [Verrucomicrobiae bacterium]|nr:FecR domain-containing protein [Verrucomicrobiae bacterium]